jgi:hypothetical protein
LVQTATSQPSHYLNVAALSADLTPGDYYIVVTGAGGYGNTGQYKIAGIIYYGMEGGSFTKVELPPPSLPFPALPPIQAGDFNSDSKVDGADLADWIFGFIHAGALFSNGDDNSDGHVDGADFLSWQRNQGAAAGSAAVTSAAVAVEPPSTSAHDAAIADFSLPWLAMLQDFLSSDHSSQTRRVCRAVRTWSP